MPSYPSAPVVVTVNDFLASISVFGNVAGYYVWLVSQSDFKKYGPSNKTGASGAWTIANVPVGTYESFYGPEAVVGTPPSTWIYTGASPYVVSTSVITVVANAKGDTQVFGPGVTAGAMTNGQSTLTDATNNPFVLTDVGKKIDIYPTVLVTPTPDGWTYATTGGSLAAGTYWYRIAARNASGVTLASMEMSIVVPTGTATNTVTVGWFAVSGATSYDVFGRTSGAELLIANTAATNYTDTGAITPSGALPGANTTANNAMTLSGLTITGYTSPSVVTVSSPATATVTGQSYAFGTDDTAALNSVVASNRKVVLPPGIYWLSNTWSWNGVNNFLIQGSGKGASVLRRGNGVNQRMLDVISCQKWRIQDLGFDQNGVTNGSSATCHGVYWNSNCSDGVVQQNGFYNSPGLAIFTFGGANNWSYNARVWNNDVVCLDGATFDVIAPLSKGGSMAFNRVFATAALAINVYESRDFPCFGNQVFLNGQAGSGIRVSSSLGCPVSMNTVVGATNDIAFSVLKETDNANATPQTEALIAQNTIRGCQAFRLDNCSGTSILGNILEGCFSGVNFNSGTIDDTLIADNHVINMGGGGFIAKNVTPTNFTIRDNKGYNPVGGPVTGVPLVSAAGSGGFTTNNTGFDCMIYLTTGSGVTVSAIALYGAPPAVFSGTVTGLTMAQNSTIGPIPLRSGAQIVVTYAGGTPAWQWFGD